MSVHPRRSTDIHKGHLHPGSDCPHCGTGSGRYGALPPLTADDQVALQLNMDSHARLYGVEPSHADAQPRQRERMVWVLVAMVGALVVLLSVLFVMYVLNAATGPPGVVPSVNAPPMPHPGVTR